MINYISKEEGLPDGDESIGDMMGYKGIEHYYYGPNLHKYLHEVRTKAFDLHDAFSVGETPGVGMKMAQLITGEERKELEMRKLTADRMRRLYRLPRIILSLLVDLKLLLVGDYINNTK